MRPSNSSSILYKNLLLGCTFYFYFVLYSVGSHSAFSANIEFVEQITFKIQRFVIIYVLCILSLASYTKYNAQKARFNDISKYIVNLQICNFYFCILSDEVFLICSYTNRKEITLQLTAEIKWLLYLYPCTDMYVCILNEHNYRVSYADTCWGTTIVHSTIKI